MWQQDAASAAAVTSRSNTSLSPSLSDTTSISLPLHVRVRSETSCAVTDRCQYVVNEGFVRVKDMNFVSCNSHFVRRAVCRDVRVRDPEVIYTRECDAYTLRRAALVIDRICE